MLFVWVITDKPSVRAVRAIGTNATPVLLCWLSHEPSGPKRRFTLWMLGLRLHHGWIPDRFVPDIDDRQELALLGLQVLGEQARPAIPVLTAMASDTNRPASFRGTIHSIIAIIRAPQSPAPLIDSADPRPTNAPAQ